LHRLLSARPASVEYSGCGLHIPERGAGETLRHSQCDRRGMAPRGGREEVFPFRHSWAGDDTRETIRRVAHESNIAWQLAHRSVARRETAQAAEGRATPARRRDFHRGIDRAATCRET